MIAALVAEDLKIRRVVVPPHPGLFSALGLLLADLQRVFRETLFTAVTDTTIAQMLSTFARLRMQAEREFETYGCQPDQIQWECFLEMRYSGQGFELLVPVELRAIQDGGAPYLVRAFEAIHRSRYGTTTPQYSTEITTYRLVARVPAAHNTLDLLRLQDDPADAAQASQAAAPARGGQGTRSAQTAPADDGVIHRRGESIPCRFFWRADLPDGWSQTGACVIEEPTATTMVPAGWRATVHSSGALVLEHQDPS